MPMALQTFLDGKEPGVAARGNTNVSCPYARRITRAR
jgi:hypothetical protein